MSTSNYNPQFNLSQLNDYSTKLSWHLTDLITQEFKQPYQFKITHVIENKSKIIDTITQCNTYFSTGFITAAGTGYIVVDHAICHQFCYDFAGTTHKQLRTSDIILLEFAAEQIFTDSFAFNDPAFTDLIESNDRITIDNSNPLSLLNDNYALFQMRCDVNNSIIGNLYFIWPLANQAKSESGKI